MSQFYCVGNIFLVGVSLSKACNPFRLQGCYSIADSDLCPIYRRGWGRGLKRIYTKISEVSHIYSEVEVTNTFIHVTVTG